MKVPHASVISQEIPLWLAPSHYNAVRGKAGYVHLTSKSMFKGYVGTPTLRDVYQRRNTFKLGKK
jgi:hypothetical protein